MGREKLEANIDSGSFTRTSSMKVVTSSYSRIKASMNFLA